MINRPVKGYAICTEPRSGSNYLCQVLTATGSLGRPLEYFNAGGRRVFDDPDYPEDRERQLEAITVRGATPNGLYGVKLFSHQFDELPGLAWARRLPGLRFVHLERRDLLGQAISRVKADQTGRFRASAPPSGASVWYDRDAISVRLNEIIVGNGRWRLYFAQNNVRPLSLFYEDVVEDPRQAARLVADFMNEPVVPQFCLSSIDLQVQRDALSDAWRKRYLAEMADLDALPKMALSERSAGLLRWSRRLREIVRAGRDRP